MNKTPSHTRTLRFLGVIAVAMGVSACGFRIHWKPYKVPLRTPEQISEEISQACKVSVKESRPVLIEFGAKWCGPCHDLNRETLKPALQSELANWEVVHVNVGDGEHDDLLEEVDVSGFPDWVAAMPSDCSVPLEKWQKLYPRIAAGRGAAERMAEELASTRKKMTSEKSRIQVTK